ncbi:hypothetical protein BJ170DRAFT_637642 [Xylariales sp. AK1849]|nr:hypothetical protein BJ170DRAFT_637642 [Xylariales sp. AK1849]
MKTASPPGARDLCTFFEALFLLVCAAEGRRTEVIDLTRKVPFSKFREISNESITFPSADCQIGLSGCPVLVRSKVYIISGM